MSKNSLGKILLITFFVLIFFISYIELKMNWQDMKVRYTVNQSKNHQINGQKNQDSEEAKADNFSIIENETSEKLQDEDKQKINLNNWISIERKDSYNNELQFYSKDNVVINEDIIEITSRKESRENKMYTSGLVESTFAYKYGYFEFIIEVSEGKGIFPAIWFMPNDGKRLPEIDLFEMIGSEPDIFYGVIHFEEDGIEDRDYFAHKVQRKKEYTVSLEWKPESLTWHIDNQEIYSTTKGVPQEYMYIIINQAIGGNWPGNPDEDTIFPNKFKILSTYINPVFKKGRD
jgi:beta-glucanase (GH16 family)